MADKTGREEIFAARLHLENPGKCRNEVPRDTTFSRIPAKRVASKFFNSPQIEDGVVFN